MPTPEQPDDVNSKFNALNQRIKDQEDKIHALEVKQDLLAKINGRNPKFNRKDLSIAQMEGYIMCLDDMPNSSPKQHSVAETVPAAGVVKQRKADEPIDEDELVKDTGSAL